MKGQRTGRLLTITFALDLDEHYEGADPSSENQRAVARTASSQSAKGSHFKSLAANEMSARV